MSKHTMLNLDGVNSKYYKTSKGNVVEVSIYEDYSNFHEIDEAYDNIRVVNGNCNRIADERNENIPYLVFKDIASYGTHEQKLELAKQLATADFCKEEFDIERHTGVVTTNDYNDLRRYYREEYIKELGIEIGKEANYAISKFHNPYGTNDYHIHNNPLTDEQIYEEILTVGDFYIMETLFSQGADGYLTCGYKFEEHINNMDASVYEYYAAPIRGYDWESVLLLLPSDVQKTRDDFGIFDFDEFIENAAYIFKTWVENDIGYAREYNIESADTLREDVIVFFEEDLEDVFGNLEYIGEFFDIDDCADYLAEQSSLANQIANASSEKTDIAHQPSHQDPIL